MPQHSLQGCSRTLLLSQLPAALLIAVLFHFLQLAQLCVAWAWPLLRGDGFNKASGGSLFPLIFSHVSVLY